MIKGLRSAILIFICLLTQKSVAQNGFEEGYVITNTNDTLYGKISDRKTGAFGGIYDKIRFKRKRKKKRFSPKQIKGYKMGDTYFNSLLLNDEMTFLKVVSEGYLTHYIFELQEQGEQLVLDIDYLQKGPNGQLVRATQGIFGLKRKRLIGLLNDCPELVKKIQNKEFKRLSQVVDFYNVCKSKNP